MQAYGTVQYTMYSTGRYSTRCTVQDGPVHDVQYTVYSNDVQYTVQDGTVHDVQYGTV